ncbi:DHA2 family efflux MFS transporter permease subunit [Frankia sp. Cppng1_Ct_nod]|uniref:DHA2 family efflux MFS transporter permease subunit n=1 Tax=Frankia sp. Cppng1_Ct_nod TaxID=2897162 RepID=UPI001040ECF3|nr:DHA2 family efflux MFS transporter permease subunit [Frankia sp. Cppng1_Ct_nod]
MPRRWKVLTLVSIGVFMVSLDLFIVNVAFPKIEGDFRGSSVSTVSWVLNAYAIVLAALMVSAGRVADRHGRRRAFLVGLLIFIVGSALCGAAPSVGALVGARVVQAVGAALLLPTSLALLLPEFEPAERPAAIGVWAAIGGLAAAAGPPVGGLLVQASWRLVFLVNVPVGLAALAYGMRLLRESRDETQQRPDLLGSGLIIVAVGVLALGLVKAPGWGWSDARTIAALAGTPVGLLAFWARCRTHRSPVIDPAMLRVRAFMAANVASLFFSAAFAAFLLGNVLFMTSVWHNSVLVAGLSLTPGPATAAAFAATSGRYINRFGQRTLGTLGIVLFSLGCLWWLLRIGQSPNYAGEMLPGLLITGIGVGLVLPSLASAASSALPPTRFATGSAVFTMTRQTGFVLGVSIFVAVLGTPSPTHPVTAFDHGWIFMIIVGALGASAALFIGRVHRAPTGTAGTTDTKPQVAVGA